MSGQNSIDRLFRKKLERRSFPFEHGELDEVRAMIDLHNAAGVARTGWGMGWWFTALIPLAGLMWWGVASPTGTPDEVATVAAERLIGPADAAFSREATTTVGEKDMKAVGSMASVDQEEVHPDGTSLPVRATASERSTTGNGLVDGTGATDNNTPRAAMRSMWAKDATPTAGRTEKPRTGTGAKKTAPFAFVDLDRTTALAADDRRSSDAIEWMKIRSSFPGAMEAPAPVAPEMVVMQRRSLGELHLFGAPLGTRTILRDGTSAATAPSSLFGLEYRVRKHHLSLATGIHYGTYSLGLGGTRSDATDVDVRLDYVEVPLLVGYELGMGRVGMLVQGGVSLDFLFNAAGSYPSATSSMGSGIPDEAFSTLNYSCLLRPQVTYNVTELLSVNAGPMWKQQLTGVANEGPLDGARARSFGVSFGVRWHLTRTTF